jgi:hypothetical protein
LAIGALGVCLPRNGLAADVASPGFHFLAADASLRAQIQNATPIMGQAAFVGEVLKNDQPWEADYLYNYPGSVVIDPATGQWLMYYELKRKTDSAQCTALATSTDGVHWTKPALNISGSKYTSDPNNNFINNTSATWIGTPNVFIDPNAPASQRYRMSEHSDIDGAALYASASPNGQDWQRVGVIDDAGGEVMDSQNTAFYDPKTNQYISYMRCRYPSGRGVMTKRSGTFDANWTGDREYTIDPGAIPQIAANSTNKPDIYCSSVVPYKGQYIGLPTMYYHPTTQSDGPVYPTLMYSRDSSTWSFEDPYKPIINLSAHGQLRSDNLDFGQAYMMTTLPEKDGWLYMYYGWYPEQHNTFPQSSSITYLAKLREDRFAGIQATGNNGSWTTSAITLSSDPSQQLIFNAVIDGSVRVEVLDSTTLEPLIGFSEADGLAIGPGDYLNATAMWNGHDNLNALAGQTVVLRFLMDDATIYSFRLAPAPEPSTAALLMCAGVCLLVLWRRCRWHRAARHAMTFGCVALLAIASVMSVGCGKSAVGKPLHGKVACGDEKAPLGQVSFVPVQVGSGPIVTALILDGQYRVAAPGGVPFGKYRVQVDARKTTGRKVRGDNGREVTMVDETVRMGPETYAGEQSPLVVDVHSGSDATFDIVLP